MSESWAALRCQLGATTCCRVQARGGGVAEIGGEEETGEAAADEAAEDAEGTVVVLGG